MVGDTPARFLNVGLRLQCIFPGDGEDVQCHAALLGWKEDHYLICELPSDNGRLVDIISESPCVVRYFFEGRMVGYRTEVRVAQLSPEPLLFLAYPEKIEQIVLRKNPRVHLDQPISLLRADPRPAVIVGVMKDLSSAGCRIETVDPAADLPIGTPVRMEFALPGVGQISNLIGTVKNVSQQGRRVIIGLEFQFHQLEFIEFHGWGGTVKKAIERFVVQRQSVPAVPEEVRR